MANLRTIKEEKKKKESKKKGGQGNKGRTSKKKPTPKKDTKIAYKPKTQKEKADAYAELVRKLKSGELTPSYRWHGGGTTDFGDKD